MKSVTGRDGYIIAQALAYAIEAIGALPPERREESNRTDMKRLLDAMIDSDRALARVIQNAHAHLIGDGHPSSRGNERR